jgi:hypothetical protein
MDVNKVMYSVSNLLPLKPNITSHSFRKVFLSFYFSHPFRVLFFYALHRTNGNVFKSLQFALYWLAIKSGLIGANLPLKLDQDQPTQR